MRDNVKIKGIPQHGLILIGPGEPAFQEELSSLMGYRIGRIGTVIPLSVILENKSDKAVVAYKLRWEFVNEKGRTVRKEVTYQQPNALLDQGTPKGNPEGGFLIAPEGKRLVSLVGSMGQDSDISNSDPRIAPLTDELRTARGLTVILDGAVFEDGTVVGRSNSTLFETFKASVDAKQDLMDEIFDSLRKGLTEEQIAGNLRSSIDPNAVLNPGSASEAYLYSRREHVQEFLNVRDKAGFQAALGVAHEHRYKTRPNFKRVDVAE